MDSTWGLIFILLAGIVVVVGSILAMRLHAFLALISAAFIVALLTPSTALQRYHVTSASFPVDVQADSQTVTLHAGEKQGVSPDMRYLLISRESDSKSFQQVGQLRITKWIDGDSPGEQWSQAEIVSKDEQVALAPTLGTYRAIHSLEMKSALKASNATIGARVSGGFGGTCVKIGILIAMAAIIGKCLLDSGAADRIVRTTLSWFGERAAPAAFMVSGFFLGIPVFFDTVFYLMIPLGKAMRLRTGGNYILYVLTIVCGATMAHSLVPPTPGPLLVAEELGVDLGVMILGGAIVGLFAAGFGYLYATLLNRRVELPLRESADFSLADLEESMQIDESELPSFGIACLPIVLPVLLISLQTIVSYPGFPIDLSPGVKRTIATLGDKNVALILSAIVAMATLIRQKKRSFAELSTSVQSALASGGVIILITAAGGAFGQVLRQTGVAELIQNLPEASPQIICILAFLITTAIRTAQGSASVAMITAAGILSGIARDGNLPFETFYLAAAIGCGSKPISWMNDSGFWVITKMSGMTEAEGLKYITPMTACMGLVGLIVVLIGVTIYPVF
ncbi:GntP family permease [Thalassoglobus polymorphus]|uniref:Inner membrane permease YgbN n=1 Tax=Thalassoglobus polymorphus TaxID=2527994 RepID=A0A517QRM3_9PLAN|nr:GntP family permease [Thalassoglobus polymorphus]QDT34265.1 Inner membrane permease YgbN [Thalassoglobus polymorphus]